MLVYKWLKEAAGAPRTRGRPAEDGAPDRKNNLYEIKI